MRINFQCDEITNFLEVKVMMQIDILVHSRAICINFQLPFSIFLQRENNGRILLLIISILALYKKKKKKVSTKKIAAITFLCILSKGRFMGKNGSLFISFRVFILFRVTQKKTFLLELLLQGS